MSKNRVFIQELRLPRDSNTARFQQKASEEYKRKNPPDTCACDLVVHGKKQHSVIAVSYPPSGEDNSKGETKMELIKVSPQDHDAACERFCQGEQKIRDAERNNRVVAGAVSVTALTIALGLTIWRIRKNQQPKPQPKPQKHIVPA